MYQENIYIGIPGKDGIPMYPVQIKIYNTTYTVDTRYYFFDAFVMVLPASGHRNFTFFITLVWLYLMMDMIFPRFPFLNLVVPIGEPFSIPFCIVAMLF